MSRLLAVAAVFDNRSRMTALTRRARIMRGRMNGVWPEGTVLLEALALSPKSSIWGEPISGIDTFAQLAAEPVSGNARIKQATGSKSVVRSESALSRWYCYPL